MDTPFENTFCPVCKYLIETEAVHCPNCGAILFGSRDVPSTTAQISEEEARTLAEAELIDESQYPDEGIAIFLYKDPSSPISIQQEPEFTLGRRTGITSDIRESVLLDLGPYNGYTLGVSRRHALIRQIENGYEIIDLESTNGTRLNNVRMVPKQPYKLENGSVVRTGNLFLYVVFRPKSKDKSDKAD